jgi:4-amino-4-deoxy-L-arabinose transferase-like glycosyltransferase
MKKITLYSIILAIFVGVLFFFYRGDWDLRNADEPHDAQVAKEMLYGEGWIIPHLNNAVYYDNPPSCSGLSPGRQRGSEQ